MRLTQHSITSDKTHMHELESVQVARQKYNDAEQRKRKSRTS